MSFLVKGNKSPENIPEGKAPKNMRGGGFFRSLAQASIEAARENNSGMGLSPVGRRRRRKSKFRMAGEDFAPILFRSKKRGGGAEAVNYSPRTREKDEMERKMKEKAEGRRVRRGEPKKDLSGFDFSLKRPKYGKDLITPDNFDGKRVRPPVPMSKEDYDQINRRKRKGNMQDTNHSFRIR